MLGSDEQNLEKRLRDLPPPPIPDGLETRLLAGIPSAPPARAPDPRSRKRRMALGAIGAIAAAILLAIVLIRAPDRSSSRKILSKRATDRDVQARFIQPRPNPRETRPCDIFPPLDSYASLARSF